MPGCEFGAETRPELVGLRTWLNADTLDAAIQTFLAIKFPNWRVSIAASLIDFVDLCELNPDPPKPFDVSLLFEVSQPSLLGPAIPSPALSNWIYQWLLYQSFLVNCVCKDAPVQPGKDCIAPPASFTIGNVGSIAGPFPAIISDTTYGSIVTHPNGDWDWFRHGHATVDGGAHNGNELLIQYQASTGAWITCDDIQTLNLFGTGCNLQPMASATPRFLQTTNIRILNNAGGTHTITNFAYCFCALAPTAPPLPVFTPPTGVPDAPVPLCSLDDVCKAVTEVLRRLTVLSATVSDLQAQLTAGDVLVELGRETISGEGEVALPAGCRGVSIELTTLGGGAYTSALGRPRGLMRVGNVRWGTSTGYTARTFIDGDRWDAPRPVNVSSLSYQLLSGTTGILKYMS